MVDTVKSITDLKADLADNTDGAITANHIRHLLETTYPAWYGNHTGDSEDIHWDGDLAGMTELDVTGTTTWTEDRGRVSVLVNGTTAGDVNTVLKARTFAVGDAFVIPVLAIFSPDAAGGDINAGLIFSDGATASDNCVTATVSFVNVAAAAAIDAGYVLEGAHGTLTANTTIPWVSDAEGGLGPLSMIFCKIVYTSTSAFTISFSPDGITYSSFGEAAIDPTMTLPTHVGAVCWQVGAVDAIVTFGPITKVA